MKFTSRPVGVFEVITPRIGQNEIFDSQGLENYIKEVLQRNIRNICVDFSNFTYLYNDTVNTLFSCNKTALKVLGRLTVLSPHPAVSEILERSGLSHTVRVYHSEDEISADSKEILRQTQSLYVGNLKQTDAPMSDKPPAPRTPLTQDREAPPSPRPAAQAPPPRPEPEAPRPAPETEGHRDFDSLKNELGSLFGDDDDNSSSAKSSLDFLSSDKDSSEGSVLETVSDSIVEEDERPVISKPAPRPPEPSRSVPVPPKITRPEPVPPRRQEPPPRPSPVRQGPSRPEPAPSASIPVREAKRAFDTGEQKRTPPGSGAALSPAERFRRMGEEEASPEPAKKKSALAIISAIVIPTLILGGAMYYYLSSGKKEGDSIERVSKYADTQGEIPQAPAAAPAPAPVPPAAAIPEPPKEPPKPVAEEKAAAKPAAPVFKPIPKAAPAKPAPKPEPKPEPKVQAKPAAPAPAPAKPAPAKKAEPEPAELVEDAVPEPPSEAGEIEVPPPPDEVEIPEPPPPAPVKTQAKAAASAPSAPKTGGAMGAVFISSSPPTAQIVEDGKVVGVANRAPVNLSVGKHKLTLSKGSLQTEIEIEVNEGKNKPLFIKLR